MRWLARGEPHLPEGTQWLTAAEAQRAAGMRFTKRRTEYLVRRLAAKTAVATALGLGVDPSDLGRVAVLNRLSGAPYVLVDDQPLGLDVSLTDRAGWGVCLVGPDLGAVGCDVELAEPRSAAFVADFLTPHEQDLVRGAADPDDGHLLANLVWSAKESALKVLRTGLRRDTRTVEVHLGAAAPPAPDGWAPLQVRTEDRGVLPGWWHRAGPWLLTVAYARPGPAPQPLERPSALVSAAPTHSWLTSPLVHPEKAAIPRSSASTT
jgi:4'-phosphopantetheinyl transferase